MPVSTHISAVPPKSFESMMIPRNDPLIQAINPRDARFLYTKYSTDFAISELIF